jgi:phage baseplate assembly protein W
MFSLRGSCLASPVRPDARGSLAVVSGTAALEQELIILIETRPGERILVPDFGIPDYAFAVKGAGATKALSHLLRQQVLKYVPGIERIDVTDVASEEHRLVLRIEYTERGSNTPNNLVYPTRRFGDL